MASKMIRRLVPHLVLLTFVVVTLYPIIFVLETSLKTNKEFYANPWLPPTNIHWENYQYAWTRGHIGRYFLNSAIVVTVTVLLVTIFSLLAGYSLARLRPWGGSAVLGILVASMFIPFEVMLVPLFILVRYLGLLNTLHNLILVYTGGGVSLSTYIFYSFFISLPSEIEDAARVDGCNTWQLFWKIAVPLSTPAIAASGIINFLFNWGHFLWPLVSTTRQAVKVLPLGLVSFQFEHGIDWGPLSAAICIIIVPIIVSFVSFQRQFVRGITSGALVG